MPPATDLLGRFMGDEAKVFVQFLDTSPDAMVVVGPDGAVLAANQHVKTLFGHRPDDLVGELIEILVPHRFRSNHPAQRESYFAQPKVRPMGAGLDLYGLHADGREIPVEISLSPVHTPGGILVTAAVRDVTDRRRQEQMLRDLLESAPDAMVIVDRTGAIRLVNSQTERVFGHPRDQILGHPVEILIPDRYRQNHPLHRDRFFDKPSSRPMGMGLQLNGLRRDGTEFPVELSLSPIQTHEGVLVAAAVRDVTDRRRDEEKIRRSLAEKEVLLKEIHHRVKNNLQVIASLLNLQSAHVQNQDALEAFQDSRNRIKTMALVHESLYQSHELSAIDSKEYLERLARDLVRSYASADHQIRLQLDITPIRLTIDSAIQNGLILNELISNALKHAFQGRERGTLVVSLHHAADHLELAVKDDGVGIPGGFDIEHAQSLGLRLVRTLAVQLRGKVHVASNGGTGFHVTFPAEGNLLKEVDATG